MRAMAPPPSSGSDATAAPLPTISGLIARLRGILTDKSDSRLAQLMAGKVFLVRVANAILMLLSQVLLARWMGTHEFGIFIYVWTWVLMIGALSDMGLSSAAKRFIPEYTEYKAFDKLRGFLTGSCWLAFAIATIIAALGALGVWLLGSWLDHYLIVPLYLACVMIPVYGLVQVASGIAAAYDWPGLAFWPFYIIRTTLVIVLMGIAWLIGLPTDAHTALLYLDHLDLRHHHWPAHRAQPAPQDKGGTGPEAIRSEDMARHRAADFSSSKASICC